MEALVILLIVVLIVRLFVIGNRMDQLFERVTTLESIPRPSDGSIRDLVSRVWNVERKIADMQAVRVVPAAEAPVAPPPKAAKQEPVVEIHNEAAGDVAAPVPPPLPTAPEPVPLKPRGRVAEPEPIVPGQFESPKPTLGERVRELLGNEEWEALLGGSLLNKLGALVLIVGIALFLGYSLTYMSPVGRSLTALIVSVSMLVAGVRLEGSSRYRVFARGFIGGGWAGVYATCYAMYALPAAKVIDSPVLGSVLLLTAAAGMIGHSLFYRAQSVTAVAYFTAFAALAVTPSTTFAVASLIPLAASLLYLAHRFQWYPMALFGLAATWMTCISRGSSGAPLIATQTLFLVYWLLFEGFDLLRVKSRVAGNGIEWIFPINGAAFLGLSFVAWSQKAPHDLWFASALAAGLYLASAVARALLRPAQTFSNRENLAERIRYGGFEGALTISAVLSGLAVVGRVPGIWKSVGLALEAEILYVAGVRLNSRFVRGLGSSAFVSSLARILLFDAPASSSTVVLGHAIYNWTPTVLFHALLFYVNRALVHRTAVFSYAASGLVAIVLAVELPQSFVGSAWLIFAALLFELGLRRRLVEFGLQAYLLAVVGVGASVVDGTWTTLPIGLAVVYGYALRTRWLPPERFPEVEHNLLAQGAAGSSAILSLVLLWRTVPGEYLGLSWFVLAIVLLELGLKQLPLQLRVFAYPVAAAGAVAVALSHLLCVKYPSAPVWISLYGAAVCALVILARIPVTDRQYVLNAGGALATIFVLRGLWATLAEPIVVIAWTAVGLAWLEVSRRSGMGSLRVFGNMVMAASVIRLFTANMWDSARMLTVPLVAAALYWVAVRERGEIVRAYLWSAALVIVTLLRVQFGDPHVTLAWALFALGLLVIGVRWTSLDLRLQSYLIAALSFLLAVVNIIGLTPSIERWLIPAMVAAVFYAAQFLSQQVNSAERYARVCFSLLATVLLTCVMWREVSGGLFTVACGIQALLLLAAGFPLRERILRLQGLALLLACILKLFIYDLRNLETLYRILSFITLGLILLGVSWVYARFRERLRRYF